MGQSCCKPNKCGYRIKVVKLFRAPRSHDSDDSDKFKMTSVCLLKDKRLVSGDKNGSIIVYNRSYKPQIHIEKAHYIEVLSLYVCRSGELLSAGKSKNWLQKIKLWSINEDDYYLTYIFYGDFEQISKVIELKDGRICSSSLSDKIRIWENYRNNKILCADATATVKSILEVNNFIISFSELHLPDNFFMDIGEVKIWDELTYQAVATIKDVDGGNSNSSLSKLNENTLILGGNYVIYFFDMKTYQINKFENKSLGRINSLYANRNGLVIIKNNKGKILCYDSSSNQIIFKKKCFPNEYIFCILATDDNHLIACSKKHIFSVLLRRNSDLD